MIRINITNINDRFNTGCFGSHNKLRANLTLAEYYKLLDSKDGTVLREIFRRNLFGKLKIDNVPMHKIYKIYDLNQHNLKFEYVDGPGPTPEQYKASKKRPPNIQQGELQLEFSEYVKMLVEMNITGDVYFNDNGGKDAAYAPNDNRIPFILGSSIKQKSAYNKKSKKRKKSKTPKQPKTFMQKRVLTYEAWINSGPTHGKPNETREEYEARIEARRRREREGVDNSPLTENDEAYIEELFNGFEIDETVSIFMCTKELLERFMEDVKVSGNIDDAQKTFRSIKHYLHRMVQDSNIKQFNKHKINECLVNCSTPKSLYESFLTIKTGSYGHDYRTGARR